MFSMRHLDIYFNGVYYKDIGNQIIRAAEIFSPYFEVADIFDREVLPLSWLTGLIERSRKSQKGVTHAEGYEGREGLQGREEGEGEGRHVRGRGQEACRDDRPSQDGQVAQDREEAEEEGLIREAAR